VDVPREKENIVKIRFVPAAVGLAAATGIVITGASLASADPTTAAPTAYGQTALQATGEAPSQSAPQGNGNTDPTKPMRSDETLLTGDTKTKVTAAAKAKEPKATIERVETDSDGVYEAHMVRADGTHIIVQVGKDFTVTHVIVGGPGGSGGPGGGQPGQAPQGEASPST
jgi:hypothetical protein